MMTVGRSEGLSFRKGCCSLFLKVFRRKNQKGLEGGRGSGGLKPGRSQRHGKKFSCMRTCDRLKNQEEGPEAEGLDTVDAVDAA